MRRTVKIVDDEPHPEDSVNFFRSTKLYESDYSSGEDNTVSLIKNDIAKISNPLTCPSKLATFQLHFSWTPGARAVFKIDH